MPWSTRALQADLPRAALAHAAHPELPSDFVYEIGHYGNVSNVAYTAVEKTRSRDIRVVVIGAGFAIT
ncbi:Probable monooxygenase [Mycobacteroides abscessus subsp. massiliense]|nr:Probable monooxygenase [Mycobacteroides abscessus subsp. massiliense]SLC88379.1 Probable monooxygenase [Mycobacteroides abscessus subsp. massiliense]